MSFDTQPGGEDGPPLPDLPPELESQFTELEDTLAAGGFGPEQLLGMCARLNRQVGIDEPMVDRHVLSVSLTMILHLISEGAIELCEPPQG